MENILTLEIVENEPQNEHIWVQYNLEGKTQYMYIMYDHFALFINNANIIPELKVEGMNINIAKFSWDDTYRLKQDHLEELVYKYLHNHHCVDIRLENQRLKEENEALTTQVNMARVQLNVIDVHIDYFTNIMSHVRNLPKTPDIANNSIITTLKNELEDACHRAVMCFNEDKQWIKERVLKIKDLPNQIRKSA
ncbi:MAG TPA: hypothetical protein VKZ95_07990 [Sphingobacteriaceae bacterium]|nr:hypothetical protein [Sphingobacteriaceae bacterium]